MAIRSNLQALVSLPLAGHRVEAGEIHGLGRLGPASTARHLLECASDPTTDARVDPHPQCSGGSDLQPVPLSLFARPDGRSPSRRDPWCPRRARSAAATPGLAPGSWTRGVLITRLPGWQPRACALVGAWGHLPEVGVASSSCCSGRAHWKISRRHEVCRGGRGAWEGLPFEGGVEGLREGVVGAGSHGTERLDHAELSRLA